MFTSFNSERPASVRVWDYSGRGNSGGVSPVIALADDCEEYQFIKTGGTVNTGSNPAVNVYLPGARIEGKKITITNTQFGLSSMNVFIYSSDTGPGSLGGAGTAIPIYQIGPGASIELVYSKEFITRGPVGSGLLSTGWHPIGMSTPTTPSGYAVNIGGRSNILNSQYCAILGGQGNSVFSSYSGVVSGQNNQINSSFSGVLGGGSNTITAGYSAIIGGVSNTSGAAFSAIAGGQANTTSSQYAYVFGGNSNTANGSGSTVIGSYYGNARFINGNTVIPANFAAGGGVGKAQKALLVLSTVTTNATPTVITSDPFSASAGNQLSLAASNTAYYFKGAVVANNGTIAKGWSIEGVIKRTGAGTQLVGTPTVTSSYGDAGTGYWAVALAADTTFNCLRVTVTGDTGASIRWVCELNSTEGVV